ncbi:hypothetical protein HDIA_0779 [Hartmannibacter diazotrophicus]|uniref:Prophage minor tail protein Z (GPZ) n=1 Tax=Hartmannibacter diazotrophicus TaxID=1482074 RepID=A0A2C9D246_9HYPH|nr:hypothetical protein [Hartmannibacter diazotrophicus]SON54320.1 hypothetical protein HDIA_0779 [Hartmannibacter diazotrophicus]
MPADYFAVAIEGLTGLSDISQLDDKVLKTAKLAVNAATRRAQSLAARSMEQQIRFPRGYLTGNNGRLSITKFADSTDLTAKITGRDRPTSLARFVVGGAKPGTRGGVTVEVDPGIAKRMPGAFAIRLKNGNIGLALRTKSGRRPSLGAKQIAENLYLLYGPDVAEVFNQTREMIRDDVEAFMTNEFTRLLELDL